MKDGPFWFLDELLNKIEQQPKPADRTLKDILNGVGCVVVVTLIVATIVLAVIGALSLLR